MNKKTQIIFKNFLAPSDTVFEFGCGSAHNLVAVAKMFPNATIDSFEINKETFDLLTLNVKAFKLSSKIRIHHSSFINADLGQKSSFIYIDAPWGGKEYAEAKEGTYELYLDSINVKEITRRLIVNGKTDTVVLKVPRNYRFDDLKTKYGFNVKREDVKDGDRISYVLLKLTLPEQEIKKCFIRSLFISSFLTIFDSLGKFIPDFKFDKNALEFALRIVCLDEKKKPLSPSDKLVHLDEKIKLSLLEYYETLLKPYLIEDDSHDTPESHLLFQKLKTLAPYFQQCVEAVVDSVNEYNFIKVTSRILLFKKSRKVSVKDVQQVQEDVKPLDDFILVNEESGNESESSEGEESSESDESESERSERSGNESENSEWWKDDENWGD